MTGKQPIQGLVSASWAVLGQFPASLLSELSNELLATMVMPEPLLPGKATQKWLKKNPSHPVLICKNYITK